MKHITSICFLLFFVFSSNLLASKTPAELFKNCAKCHGKDGKNPAFDISDEIAGQSVEDLIESINFFKNSKFGKKGVINVMAKQVKHLNNQQIEELSVYISNLGKK